MSARAERRGKGGPIHFAILTGTSGSGKSYALKCLEDVGFFCVDNLPLALLSSFVDLCEQSSARISKVALVVDVRERFNLDEGANLVAALRQRGHRVETLFFDADDGVLIRRFSETRRPHPLSPEGSVVEGLSKEREKLTQLRNIADRRIDTSNYSVHDLREYIQSHYGGGITDNQLTISVVAFGFKYGIPLEADMLFDVRFLQNPHFVPELKPHIGTEPRVRDFVMADPRTGELIDRITHVLDFAIPEYEREGRNYLTIAIGCTGGRHRSVVIAHALAERIRTVDRDVEVRLRDAEGNDRHNTASGC